MQFELGVIIVSDRAFCGEREDASREVIVARLKPVGGSVRKSVLVPDDRVSIQEALLRMVDEECLPLVLTAGGTGLAPRDVTPEATHELLERPIPGLQEYCRSLSLAFTPFAPLSRGVAGCRRQTLIINLPGSPKAVEQYLDMLIPLLPHALRLLAGDVKDCGEDTERPTT